jgi:hypothetical protein
MIQLRRCGYRKPGKAYFVVEVAGLQERELPVMYFVQDPPVPVDMSLMATQGVTLLPRVVGYDEALAPRFATDARGRTIYDIYDYVGGDYPNVVDFVEEARQQGISRLTPRTTDFSKVTYESEYRLIHPKAVLADPAPLFNQRVDTGREPCPKVIAEHLHPSQDWLDYLAETCAGLWWEVVTEYDEEGRERLVRRRLAGGGTFTAARPPGQEPESSPGIFMRFPVGRLGRWDVIRSEQEAHREALERLKLLQDGLFRRTNLTEC